MRQRRRLPAPERRALILDAALRTFAANGYDGAAMDEIAAAAGISKAVVYDHVASKRELYTQLLHAIRDEIERIVEEALRAPGDDGEERVRAAVDAIYRYVEEHPEASRLLRARAAGRERLGDRPRAGGAHHRPRSRARSAASRGAVRRRSPTARGS